MEKEKDDRSERMSSYGDVRFSALGEEMETEETKRDLAEDARECAKAYNDCMDENITRAVEDMAFVDGEQWTEAEKLVRRKRPCLVINKLSSVIRQIIGNARQSVPTIKVIPVDSQADPKVAEILSGMIKSIETDSSATIAYETALEAALRGGWGWFRILTEYDDELGFDQKVTIKRVVNPFSIMFDPSAQEADLSDAKWFIVLTRMEKEEFEDKYKNAEKTQSVFASSSVPSEYSDWLGEDYCNVAEYWYTEKETKTLLQLEGKTIDLAEVPEELKAEAQAAATNTRTVETHCIYSVVTNGVETLEEPKKWAGKYFPFIFVAGEETWLGDKRVLRSLMHWAKEPQRLYNWSRSNMVETLALAPKRKWMGTAESVEGYEAEWDNAHESPKAFLPYHEGFQPPVPVNVSMPDTANMQEAMNAAEDIKATSGIYDASLGARSNETSGVAIAQRQKQGDAATYQFIDNLSRALNYAGRVLVDLIPKIYDTDRVVRLADNSGQVWTERVNVPQLGGKVNDLSLGRYDVRIDTTNYASQRIEAANGMLQFIQTYPQAAQVIAPRLANVLDWPEAQEISQELAAMSQPPQQDPQQAEMAHQAMVVEMAVKESTTAKNMAEAQKKEAETAKIVQEMQLQIENLNGMMSQMMNGRY